MKQRREKQKLRMFDVKTTGTLAQSAFAHDDGLFAAQKRINHDSPFFKCHPHERSVTRAIAQVEPTAGAGRLGFE
jgi:3-hydroxymyristoyl/3-hydroxydecanoyl-(acyl carrier protein) dehydratase